MKKPARLRIGAVEKATGLTRDAIILYVREGLVPPPERQSATVSWYTDAHLQRLGTLRELRARGFSLAQLRRVLRLAGDGSGTNDLEFLARLYAPMEFQEASISIEERDYFREQLERVGLDGSRANDPAVLGAFGPLRGRTEEGTRAALCAVREELRGVEATAGAVARGLAEALREGAPGEFWAQRARVSRAAEALREAGARRTLEALLAALPGCWERARLGSYLPLGAEGRREAERYLSREGLPAWQRLRAHFGVGSARGLGAEGRAAREGAWAWVSFGLGVAALDGRAALEAQGHFTEALARAPHWGMARAYRAAAGFLASAWGADGRYARVFEALDDLERSPPSPDDPAVLRARTDWVRATVWQALPASLGGPQRALQALEDARTTLTAAADEDEVPGERARLVGNLQLLRAVLCAAVGDHASRAEALTLAQAVPGPIAHAARALAR
jgi:DNA-binding transcriptional MerR regulator